MKVFDQKPRDIASDNDCIRLRVIVSNANMCKYRHSEGLDEISLEIQTELTRFEAEPTASVMAGSVACRKLLKLKPCFGSCTFSIGLYS
jgi:hypothetical protein